MSNEEHEEIHDEWCLLMMDPQPEAPNAPPQEIDHE